MCLVMGQVQQTGGHQHHHLLTASYISISFAACLHSRPPVLMLPVLVAVIQVYNSQVSAPLAPLNRLPLPPNALGAWTAEADERSPPAQVAAQIVCASAKC